MAVLDRRITNLAYIKSWIAETMAVFGKLEEK